jgi:hypothetical protein
MRVLGAQRVIHLDEAQLEAYSMGKLPESELAECEEHLLICDSCRQLVEESDIYTRSMHDAAARLRAQEENPRRTLLPRFVPVLAAAVLILGIGIALRVNRPGSVTPVTVTLDATRGGGLVAQVPAGRQLLLKPNLNGLPAFPEYHLQILDRTGKRIWQGNFKAGNAVAVPEEPSGIYIVELYTLPGALLREYAMEVK